MFCHFLSPKQIIGFSLRLYVRNKENLVLWISIIKAINGFVCACGLLTSSPFMLLCTCILVQSDQLFTFNPAWSIKCCFITHAVDGVNGHLISVNVVSRKQLFFPLYLVLSRQCQILTTVSSSCITPVIPQHSLLFISPTCSRGCPSLLVQFPPVVDKGMWSNTIFCNNCFIFHNFIISLPGAVSHNVIKKIWRALTMMILMI